MNVIQLCELLEMPEAVKTRLEELASKNRVCISEDLQMRILQRNTWDQAIKELQESIGEDHNGFKILYELLDLVAGYTYEKYQEKGISDDVFIATMKFCTRFLHEFYNTHKTYSFIWAWWFPRQISLQEYRIGALEYELVNGDCPEIAIHIPSDADLSPAGVRQSLEQFRQFQKEYYPEWENVVYTCDSWMMVPTLKELLPPDSNIVAFQDLFEIDSVDLTQIWFMGWIFPGYDIADNTLPERTTLQRELKKYLLQGKQFGIAKGHLKTENRP